MNDVSKISIDVRKLRQDLKMSQPRFADRFGLTLSTLRQWEQGRRSPDGAARILLAVIAWSPAAVDQAMNVIVAPTAPVAG